MACVVWRGTAGCRSRWCRESCAGSGHCPNVQCGVCTRYITIASDVSKGQGQPAGCRSFPVSEGSGSLAVVTENVLYYGDNLDVLRVRA